MVIRSTCTQCGIAKQMSFQNPMRVLNTFLNKFFKKNLEDISPFMMPLIPLFWTFDDVPSDVIVCP